jgi:hypothetical protein
MNEAHRRFQDWLTAGAEDDPPRDIAVHAAFCSGCRGAMDAIDLLASVNTGLAGAPAEPVGREHGRLALAGRLIGATAVLFSAAILGVGVSQLIGRSHAGGPVAQASPSADQNVLGGTATAQPSPEASPAPGETPQDTLTPLGTPSPTHAQAAITPVPRRSGAPTPVATPLSTPSGLPSDTPVSTPSATAVATPLPTPVATPVATPVPTDTPTPVPTDTPTPTPSASP